MLGALRSCARPAAAAAGAGLRISSAPAGSTVQCTRAATAAAITRTLTSYSCTAPAARSSLSSPSFPSASRLRFHASAPRRSDAAPPSPPQSKPVAPPAATPASSASSTAAPSQPLPGSGGGAGGDRRSKVKASNATMLQYLMGLGVLVLGASWAAVPLYRAFCAHTGYGGTTQQDKDGSKLASLVPSKREVTISFTADVNPSLHWRFVPSQPSLKAKLGEPVLAFYRAHNERDKAVTGVATYNVTPLKTGSYFHKIQCFCFDEQRLRAGEEVDMPVFFYIDPAMAADRTCNDVTHITLSYTFFPVPDDEDDDRSEAQKDAEGGLKLHGPDGKRLPPGQILASTSGYVLPTTPPPPHASRPTPPPA